MAGRRHRPRNAGFRDHRRPQLPAVNLLAEGLLRVSDGCKAALRAGHCGVGEFCAAGCAVRARTPHDVPRERVRELGEPAGTKTSRTRSGDCAVGSGRAVRTARGRGRRVNVHLHPASRRTVPAHPGRHRTDAWLYGLALFAQLIGSHARLLDTTLHAPGGLHLKAWATRRGSVTVVLLINKGAGDADVSIPAPSRGAPPAVLRVLRAPSIRSVGGVLYAGRSIGSDGRWHGRATTSAARVVGSHGEYRIHISAFSAVTVTIRGRVR